MQEGENVYHVRRILHLRQENQDPIERQEVQLDLRKLPLKAGLESPRPTSLLEPGLLLGLQPELDVISAEIIQMLYRGPKLTVTTAHRVQSHIINLWLLNHRTHRQIICRTIVVTGLSIPGRRV